MISQYNATGLPDGPRNIMFVMGKSLRLEGFNIANYFDHMPEFQRERCPDGYTKARSRGRKP
jgi:NADPH-dependent curcumin reductase CurA